MQSSRFRLARQIAAYVVGGILIVWGLIGFVCEFAFPEQWGTKFVYSGNLCCGVMILYGFILILATYYNYAGGIWTFLGTAFVGISMIFAAMPVDAYLTGDAHGPVMLTCLAIAVLSFLLGCYSLVAGHIRHQRKKRESPSNTALEPTATAP
jgi:peptidoglycan/LPS O-acetylase OafA/YrhL